MKNLSIIDYVIINFLYLLIAMVITWVVVIFDNWINFDFYINLFVKVYSGLIGFYFIIMLHNLKYIFFYSILINFFITFIYSYYIFKSKKWIYITTVVLSLISSFFWYIWFWILLSV